MTARKLLVIGAGLMQTPVYKLARDLGIPSVAVDRDPEAPGRPLADEWVEADIGDEEACLAAALRLGSGVGGVVTVGTDFSTTVARIAETLRLPGHRYEAALRAKDKSLMRESLRKAGVPSPDFTVLHSVPENAVDVSRYLPGVVKPADNMGARGVVRVDRAEEVGPAVASALEYSRLRKVILERYIPGPEFSLDSLVLPGKFLRRGLADRDIRFPPRFIEMGHAFPSKASPGQARQLWDCLEAGARALGLTEGAAKGDLKWDSGPVVGEIAARLSGGFMSGWSYPLASGIEPVREAILVAMGIPFEPPGDTAVRGVAEGAVLALPGKILRWEGLEELQGVSGFRHVFLQRKPGQATVFPRNNVEKAANILCEGPDRAAAESALRRARRLLVPRMDPFCEETCEWLLSEHVVPAFGPEGVDWYGISFQERLQDWERLSGSRVSELSTSEGKEMKEWLRLGGLPGALYWRDMRRC